MKVALYLRRSTNEKLQADSLAAQEEHLRRRAKAGNLTVVKVYRDSASGTTARRPAFEEMVRDITHGPSYQTVLCRDVSRFGRFFDVDEGAFYEALFLSHAVNVVYVDEIFGSEITPMAGLVKGIRRVMASEFSRDKSRLVRRGQARTAQQGFHAAGPPPYGTRRVMVKRTGEFVCDLQPGEWKALSNRKVKLMHGDEKAVEVVRLIFTKFADGVGTPTLAETLNNDGVPAPAGGRWFESTVHKILTNPIYAGYSRYTVREKGLTDTVIDESLRQIRTAGAFDAIVDEVTWNRVQERLSIQTRRATDGDLAAKIREAYRVHGCVEARMTCAMKNPPSWATYAHRFRGGADEALETAFSGVFLPLKETLVAVLSSEGEVSSTAHGVMIGSVEVSIRPIFLHRDRHGIRWRFDARRFQSDVSVAVSINPDGVADEWFVTRGDARTKGAKGRDATASKAISLHALNEVVLRIRKLVRSSTGAVEEFKSFVQSRNLVNFSEISRELGWPHHQVRKTYWRLRAAGIGLPPMKYKARRVIDVVCDLCGRSRLLQPSVALKLRTARCFDCMAKRGKRLVTVTCPRCGRRAQRWPSAVAKLSGGAATICRQCRCKRGIKRPQTPESSRSERVP